MKINIDASMSKGQSGALVVVRDAGGMLVVVGVVPLPAMLYIDHGVLVLSYWRVIGQMPLLDSLIIVKICLLLELWFRTRNPNL